VISSRVFEQIVAGYQKQIELLQAQNRELLDRLLARNHEEFVLGQLSREQSVGSHGIALPDPGTIIGELP